MLRSIRARLTLWLASLITLCITGFALVLYLAVGSVLTNNLDRTLRVQAQQVAGNFDFGGSESRGDLTSQHVDVSSINQFATAGIFIETFDPRGRLLARSSNLGHVRLSHDPPTGGLAPRAPQLNTQATPDGTVRVYTLPVLRAGQAVGLVVVAASLSGVTDTTHSLLLLLIVGGLTAVLLVVIGSGFLVRHGLRSLDEMAVVTESIHANRLDRRLSLRNPPREVARLAGTFDTMLDRLHEAFAAQRRFVADASHELRTPLAIVRGRSEVLLLKPNLDPETREGLALVRDETGRMGRLVANLLLLARGDEARAIDRRVVELDVLLLEVARQAHGLSSTARITIGHEDQAQVQGDADLIKQVLLNLVDNAITHTPPGGQVELSLTVADGEARLAVRDSGPGIAPEEVERIFERFYRLDRARGRRTGGAGLGLAIARWIVEAHGGRIIVETTRGQGSTFVVALPISNQTLTVP
ncbi:MAG TPA: ATP-binding protein [Chloroflexota bacterium]|nr:ATP-binding protein [Chloroflexota bacterium]